MASVSADLKRKRSASHDREPAALAMRSAPPAKASKVQNSHLQINYLARQYSDDLPLVSTDDTLPSVLALLNEYQGVLERHESMAGNLGARPLGPILVSRFERLFDGPPRIIRCHGKDGTTVTWLDVIEFARNKPDQFQLGQMSEGTRVCQFYTKQCRVQISEEDFQLISSGIPQKMIPPQPIMEDEEKELGTLEILEKNTSQICQLADQGEPSQIQLFWSLLLALYMFKGSIPPTNLEQSQHAHDRSIIVSRLVNEQYSIAEQPSQAFPFVPPVLQMSRS